MDDGSTDSSPDIVKKYNDPRIRNVLCQHDFVETLNKGLELTQGKYIALLDHDDLMVPKRLQIQYDYMEANPDVIACGGYMHSFGLSSSELRLPLNYEDIMKNMIIRSQMLNPTGFVRKDALVANNIRYQKGYSFAADFKFWTDLVKVGKVTNIPKILTIYRMSEKQANRVFFKDSFAASLKIQQELIVHFLSMVEENNEYYSILLEKLLPAITELNKKEFFTYRSYYPFMYELIDGLCRKGAIVIDSNPI